MGRYSFRDALLAPGLLSLSRVPLAVAFPFVLQRPALALATLGAAGVSDVLDGWLARRLGQVTATGAALDGVTDKLFFGTVAVSLVVYGFLSPLEVVLLGTRELAELPLVTWVAVSAQARRRQTEDPTANLPGKLATTLQFAAATMAIFRLPQIRWLVLATALAGALAAWRYWMRALRAVRARPARE